MHSPRDAPHMESDEGRLAEATAISVGITRFLTKRRA
jgi:hypothetical protein